MTSKSAQRSNNSITRQKFTKVLTLHDIVIKKIFDKA